MKDKQDRNAQPHGIEAAARMPARRIPRHIGWLIMIVYLAAGITLDFLVVGVYLTPISLAWRMLFVVSLLGLGALTRRASVVEQPVAEGRVVVLVPVFNEEEAILRQTIESLINQSRQPDAIYVIDDGSDIPVKPFEHPLVHWSRQDNKGKRHAQVSALRQIQSRSVDFILTVDSDSVANYYAIETMLRALSNAKVEAVTGITYTLNYNKNVLTRIIDLNMGIGCLMIQPQRNMLGAQETTCGPLTMYRARVLFDNIDDYLSSGTYGDDRRLNLYALYYGETHGIAEASTFTYSPETLRGLVRQRIRWAKSPWLQLPFMVANLKPKQLIFPLFSVLQWLAMLVIYALIVLSIVATGSLWYLFILLAIFTYVRMLQAALYLYVRPGMSLKSKAFTLFFITPLEVLLRFFVITPIKTIALFKLGNKTWGTRKSVHSERAESKIGTPSWQRKENHV